jgi:hypothetical protein
MAALLASSHYLANKPAGAALVYLIVAAVLLAVAAAIAGMTRNLFDLLVVLALLAVVLAFLT